MNNDLKIWLLVPVLLGYVAILGASFLFKRKNGEYDLFKDPSFFKMKNGGDDPCKFAETQFECVDYFEGIDFVLEEDNI